MRSRELCLRALAFSVFCLCFLGCSFSWKLHSAPHVVVGVSAHAQSDDDNEDDEEEEKPLVSDEEANNLLRDFIGVFRRRDRDKPKTRPKPGASVKYSITDWVGRPIDGVVQLANDENQYRSQSVASRNVIQGVRLGEYTVSLEPVRGLAPPTYDITLDRETTYTLVLRSLDPDADHTPFDKVDPPTAPLPSGPAIPGGRDFEPAPERSSPLELSGRNYGQGDRVVINGNAQDRIGRPLDAIAIISHNGRDIGHVRTVASRFSVFDLEPGEEYLFRARGVRNPDGPWSESRITLRHGVARLVLVVER